MKLTNKVFTSILMILLGFILLACKKADVELKEIKGYNNGIEYILDETIYTTKALNLLTDDEEDFVDSDQNDFKANNTAYVVFENGGAIITNDVENTSIYMQEGNLIVDSTQKLTLVVSGTLNGNIQINKPDGKLQMILDGVNITSTSGPAINFQTEKRVFLVINEETVNQLSDGLTHPLMSNGSSTKAAIFSEEQLIISGQGELNITAQFKHGIASDDYIKILSGNINILSAPSDGLRANDYIVIDGGDININASGDGIECEKGFIAINGGKITIDAEKNGIKAEYEDEDLSVDPWIEINSGFITIDAQEKGIVSKSKINLNQGAIISKSIGDSVSAEKEITITEGIYFLNSLEKQSLDGNQGVLIVGGRSLLFSNGNEQAIRANQIVIQGGIVLIAGAVDLNITSTDQGYLKCGNVLANEIIDLRKDESIHTIAFINGYNHVILSSPWIVSGTSYDVYTGGSITGHNFYGYFISGSYTEGSFKNSVTAN